MSLGTYRCHMLSGITVGLSFAIEWVIGSVTHDILQFRQVLSTHCDVRVPQVWWVDKETMPNAAKFWWFWPLFESESGWNVLGGASPPGPLSLQAYVAKTLHEQGPREVEWHHSVFLTKHSKQWQQSDQRHCPRLTSSHGRMRPLLRPFREMSAQQTLDTSLTWPNVRFGAFRSSGMSTVTLHLFQSSGPHTNSQMNAAQTFQEKVARNPVRTAADLSQESHISHWTGGRVLKDLGLCSRARQQRQKLTWADKLKRLKRGRQLFRRLCDGVGPWIFLDKAHFELNPYLNSTKDRVIEARAGDAGNAEINKRWQTQGLMVLGVFLSDPGTTSSRRARLWQPGLSLRQCAASSTGLEEALTPTASSSWMEHLLTQLMWCMPPCLSW